MYELIRNKVKPNQAFRLININPGFESDFGHHLGYNLVLKKAIEDLNADYITLTKKTLDSQLAVLTNALPLFTYDTWNKKENDLYEIFSTELSGFVQMINSIDKLTSNIYFMYMSDIDYLPYIIDIARSAYNKNNSFILNLFHVARHLQTANGVKLSFPEEYIKTLSLTKKSRQDLRIHLSTDSEKLGLLLSGLTEEKINVVPQFSTTNFNLPYDRNSLKRPANSCNILFPSAPTMDRGIDMITKLLTYDSYVNKNHNWLFLLREIEDEISSKIPKSVLSKVITHKGKRLDKKTFLSLYHNSDLVLVPYDPKYFIFRTSGIVFDALHLGLPVIASKNTWAGDIVEKYKFGETFQYGNVSDLYKTLKSVSSKISYYKSKAFSAGRLWEKQNNSKSFATFIKEKSNEGLIGEKSTISSQQGDEQTIQFLKSIIQKNRIIELKQIENNNYRSTINEHLKQIRELQNNYFELNKGKDNDIIKAQEKFVEEKEILEKELSRKDDELSKVSSFINKKNDEIIRLTEQLSTSTNEIEKHQKQAEALGKRVESLINEQNIKKLHVDRLMSEVDMLNSENSKLKTRLNKQNEIIGKNETLISELNTKAANLETVIKSLEKQNTKIENELNHELGALQSSLKEKTILCDNLNKKNLILQSRHTTTLNLLQSYFQTPKLNYRKRAQLFEALRKIINKPNL